MSATNLFAHLEMAPPDPILGTAVAFRNDPSPDKVNMGIGAYRTDEGVPYVFQAVREAERRILDDPSVNKEYLPIEGLADFNRLAKELLFGANSPLVTENRVATIQSISGTGALRIAAESLHQFLNPPAIYTSVPTWGNHLTIFQRAGFQLRTYPYWNEATRGLNLDGMLEALREAPEGSVILLHACAHNPTGVDPTPD